MQNCGLSPSSQEIEQLCKNSSSGFSTASSLLTRSSLLSPGSWIRPLVTDED